MFLLHCMCYVLQAHVSACIYAHHVCAVAVYSGRGTTGSWVLRAEPRPSAREVTAQPFLNYIVWVNTKR